MPTALTSRFAILAAVALSACDSDPVAPESAVDASLQITSVTTPASGPWARITEGRSGPNSLVAYSSFDALAFHARGIENVLELTHGHLPFDNSTTQYHEAALLAASQAAGTTDMLLQRLVPTYGHCAIPAALAV